MMKTLLISINYYFTILPSQEESADELLCNQHSLECTTEQKG